MAFILSFECPNILYYAAFINALETHTFSVVPETLWRVFKQYGNTVESGYIKLEKCL